MSNLKILIILSICVFIWQCKFDKILQPKSAQPGESITIEITISDDLVPEPNAHKGLLCILIPDDWSFIGGSYSGTVGNGNLQLSRDWADSAEACYPADGFAGGMKWIALISDSGYAYSKPISIDVAVQLRVGQKEGCYDLAYLVTKATKNLLCTSWTPLSYPHRIGVPDSCLAEDELEGLSAPEWDNLFYRTSGWTGADGIYSIPLNGIDYTQEEYNDYTLLTFGDTFIGEVNAENQRQNAILINNTCAIMQGKSPLVEAINFYWPTDNGNAQAVFVPNTPQSKAGDWYWPMDGLLIGDSVYVFGLRLDKSEEPFNTIGVNLLSFIVNTDSGVTGIKQIDTPLFYEPSDKSWEIVLGQAVMDMRKSSGNPGADGYIYVFGPRSSSLKKDLVAARFIPENITKFTEWEYWNGQFWGTEIAECTVITGFISQEFSLSPLAEDLFLLVFQRGDQVAIRTGLSPTGPFDIYRVVYDAPEGQSDPDIFIYNAKGHPHLSQPSEMLISYNVNSYDFADLFNDAGIYRPRFIRLSLEKLSTAFEPIRTLSNKEYILGQNYPNPFNTSTAISYQLPGRYSKESAISQVDLTIYDLLGQKIITLVSEKQLPGNYQIVWQGYNLNGQKVSSGIYYYRLRVNDWVESKKMLMLN